MKTMTIPPLRVSPELRQQAEAVLAQGESLSSFVLESVSRNIEFRRSHQDFIDRGLASAATAKASGKYVSADAVVKKLTQKLAKEKKARREI
jgi:predicted transcriptional regulator